jgi:hypothetical protein
MRRRNEINVMTAEFILEVKHTLRQGLRINFFSPLAFPVLAYLVVLAINTPQITVTKEDRPRPIGPGDDRFLSVMYTSHRDYGPMRTTAKS